jgi:hypothetical protein
MTKDTRIEALKEREREIRAQIAAEQIRLARKRQKEDARIFAIVGRALVEHASQSPAFLPTLKQALDTAVTDERARKLVAARGLI